MTRLKTGTHAPVGKAIVEASIEQNDKDKKNDKEKKMTRYAPVGKAIVEACIALYIDRIDIAPLPQEELGHTLFCRENENKY